ncbi:MAG: hypothetical protein OEX19_17065 [Gammaproteobacteria bacterium]|nr:hypothetical protein [Gammaproteobacteria bacterium]
MFTNSRIIFRRIAIYVTPALIIACGAEAPQQTCDTCTDAVSGSLIELNGSGNILSLAAPGSSQLETPWDARDTDLIRIASARTPDSEITLGAVFEVTTACTGGGTKTDIQNNEPPPWYSQGDSYTTVYAACIVGDTQTVGQQSYTVDVLTGQPYVDTTWSTGTTIARDLTKTNMLTGEVSFSIGRITEQLAVVENTQFTQVFSGGSNRNWLNNGVDQIGTEAYSVTYTWDDTTQQFQWDFDVSSTNTVLGDSSAITTQTLTGSLGSPPENGQFKSRKTQGSVTSTATITATGAGTVLVETDSDGDGIVDTVETSTWNQLILDSILNQFI